MTQAVMLSPQEGQEYARIAETLSMLSKTALTLRNIYKSVTDICRMAPRKKNEFYNQSIHLILSHDMSSHVTRTLTEQQLS